MKQNRIRKKDFIIRSRRTGSRLAGRENQVEYEVLTADGKRKVKGGFYRWTDADKWLSKNVKIANEMLKNAEIGGVLSLRLGGQNN